MRNMKNMQNMKRTKYIIRTICKFAVIILIAATIIIISVNNFKNKNAELYTNQDHELDVEIGSQIGNYINAGGVSVNDLLYITDYGIEGVEAIKRVYSDGKDEVIYDLHQSEAKIAPYLYYHDKCIYFMLDKLDYSSEICRISEDGGEPETLFSFESLDGITNSLYFFGIKENDLIYCVEDANGFCYIYIVEIAEDKSISNPKVYDEGLYFSAEAYNDFVRMYLLDETRNRYMADEYDNFRQYCGDYTYSLNWGSVYKSDSLSLNLGRWNYEKGLMEDVLPEVYAYNIFNDEIYYIAKGETLELRKCHLDGTNQEFVTSLSIDDEAKITSLIIGKYRSVIFYEVDNKNGKINTSLN